MTVHRLRTDQPHYQHILEGAKIFEARLDDRGFQEGDTLQLAERDPRTGVLTGRALERIVTGVLPRAERHWPLSQIERYGISILTIVPPHGSFEASSLNPHAAAGEIPERRIQAAVDILRERFSLAWTEISEPERESYYRDVARRILTP